MTKRFTLQPAFVLHSRPFRDNASLLDLFTFVQGKISVIANGTKFRGILRPFVPLLVTWWGKNELMNLNAAEINGPVFELSNYRLLSGIYLNELITRLLQRQDPHPQLFMMYQRTLSALQQGEPIELCLRLFEKCLLKELGYALQLDKESGGFTAVEVDAYYEFFPGRGLVKWIKLEGSPRLFKGEHLLAIHQEQLESLEVLKTAKRLMRLAIDYLLGGKPLKSREMFLQKERSS